VRIPLEIQEIRDPDGASRFKAIISFENAISHTSQSQNLIRIQNDYSKLVNRCQKLLKEIKSNHKHMADSYLQWRVANEIYSFVKRIENEGFVFANLSEALSRDVGISKSQLNYLIKFRTYYPTVNQVSKEINWSKYRELMDFPNQKSRKDCEALIKAGKIKTDTEIREFKRKIKTSKIS
jgi:hypothetical protein